MTKSAIFLRFFLVTAAFGELSFGLEEFIATVKIIKRQRRNPFFQHDLRRSHGKILRAIALFLSEVSLQALFVT
jgi:hypothetical protein